ncbi:glycine receptor subunit alphaZ1-like [Pollicipes pollicipes]|uniref:glycine receptor subunit alphaZ1-like n=1 Tax=Pollicipes pollicipes TaxID=41117 RepID=UPI001884C53B|nr:glycine receptor subunit alphaZ1-like [Pollicipes pollicipes]
MADQQRTRLVSLLLWTLPALCACTSNVANCWSGRLIPDDYDKTKTPFVPGTPLPVQTSIWVSSVTSVSELAADFTVDLYFRLKWHDRRVAYPDCEKRPFLLLESTEIDRLWIPDVYFIGEKRATQHMLMRRNAALRLNKNGSSLYLSERLTLTVICNYDFQLFPMDSQACELGIEPYVYHKEYLDLSFEDPGVYFNNFKFRIPQFDLRDVKAGNCSYTYMYQGTALQQSCVRAVFFFERVFRYHFLQIYVPSLMIVGISFLSFFVPVTVVPGRIALSITTLLTLSTQMQAVQKSLPPVSYVKASDVWMFFCIFAVFSTLIEFAISYRHCTNVQKKEVTKVWPIGARSEDKPAESSVHQALARIGLTRNRPDLVDAISKIFFPTAFVIFNIAYWSYYSGLQSEKRKLMEKSYEA